MCLNGNEGNERDIGVKREPQRLILGDVPSRGIGKDKMYMLGALVLIAHKMMTINCLKPHPPTSDQWTQRLKVVNCLGNVTAKLQLKMEVYLEKWSPVVRYLAK